VVQPDRTRRMRVATDALSIYNTYRYSTVTEVTRSRLNVMLYLHCLFCYGVDFYLLLATVF
jgi:hypothetical protein